MTRISIKKKILAGDIGGTNTRLGIFSVGNQRPELEAFKAYSSRDEAGLEQILERFVKDTKSSISGACFGIAGPVAQGRSQTTNLPWEVSERRLKKRFNWPQVRLINDLSAMGHSVAVLAPDELDALNHGEPISNSPVGVIAPGTGLGMALLVPDKKRFAVLPSEGGHSDFAPTRKIEVRLWQHLHQSTEHVSVERLLSGPGLVSIYNWLRKNGRVSEPRWLAHRMKAEDPAKVISATALEKRVPICVKALELFISIFGAVAGNFALIGLTRAGIYLGGGIAPQILPKLKDGLFIKSFINKGRFKALLQQIPVYVILNEKAPLLGAAVFAFKDQGHKFPILR
ncbi:MAG: glucokinase [Desulfobacterales bacterium]